MATNAQKIPKGLPKRVRNEKAKAKRARSWARNAKAKAIRIAENKAAFERNEAYRRRGELTPYEARRAAYYKNRG